MSDVGWATLLPHLSEAPRENGTDGLATAAAFITAQLDRVGVRWTLQEVLVHPLEPVALGLVVFSLCCAYWWLLRRSHVRAATATALLLAAVPIAQLDWQVPLTPGHTAREVNVLGVVSAAEPTQRIVLTAHYDTKTELTDHIVRLPVRIAGGLILIAAILATPFTARLKSRVWERVLGASVLAYGALFALVFSGGALQPKRSPGALDNGAACAVLLAAAARLSDGEALDTTEVIFAFFAGEEVGAQGSWAFVDDHLSSLPARRTFVVNLDPVGASDDLTIVHGEGGLLRSFKPDRSVVSLLDAAHHRVLGRPIAHTRGGGLTDAFPFLARNIPAATIVSSVSPFVLPRGLHTHADVASRIDRAALDRTLEFVIEVVRAFDREPQQNAGHRSWPRKPLQPTRATQPKEPTQAWRAALRG
jgi:hypothetical protein